MQPTNFRFEDLPNIMAENNKLLSEVKELLSVAVTPQKIPSDLLSISEASDLLKLSIPTIYSKVCKRELPYFKRGNKLYFNKIELLDYVKAGRRLTNA